MPTHFSTFPQPSTKERKKEAKKERKATTTTVSGFPGVITCGIPIRGAMFIVGDEKEALTPEGCVNRHE